MCLQKPTVNSIFREYETEYINKYNPDKYTQKVIRAITDCRTEKLGGHIQKCNSCGHEITMYNSCRNRHCPQCQFMKKEAWIQKKKDEVLPFQYFHVVFTLPDLLNPIVYKNKKLLYKLLFDTTKETLLSVAENEKYFGAKIGFFSILHTWGQKLNLHPHIHCVVPGGGFVEKKSKWISSPKDYFVPVQVLAKRFRSLFLVELKRLYKENLLYLKGTNYFELQQFQKLIDKLFETEWIVYIKESFKNSDSVIQYLSKYTHRIAISNHRILSVKNGIVSFSYKDYKNENKKKVMNIPVLRFMRNFLLHVVPHRFVRIRYFGLISNSTKKKQVMDCREYYKIKEKKRAIKTWQEIYREVTGDDVYRCKKCKEGQMVTFKTVKGVKTRAGP